MEMFFKLSQWKEAGCMLKKKFCLMDTETWVVIKSTASKSVNLATWNCLWLHRSQEGVLAGSHLWWKHFITFTQRHNFSYFLFHKFLTCKRDTTTNNNTKANKTLFNKLGQELDDVGHVSVFEKDKPCLNCTSILYTSVNTGYCHTRYPNQNLHTMQRRSIPEKYVYS